MPADFNAVLPANIIRGAGILTINGSTPFGASDGGLSFDPGITWVNRDFDGKTSNVEAQDYIAFWDPKISGVVFPISTAKAAQYEPGSTSGVVTTLTTITPQPSATELVGTTDYLSDVRLIYPLVGGGWVWVKFGRAIFTKYSIRGAKNDDAKIDIEISARLDDGVALGSCPYVIEFETAATY